MEYSDVTQRDNRCFESSKTFYAIRKVISVVIVARRFLTFSRVVLLYVQLYVHFLVSGHWDYLVRFALTSCSSRRRSCIFICQTSPSLLTAVFNWKKKIAFTLPYFCWPIYHCKKHKSYTICLLYKCT